jgi:hypothetical protein
MVEFPHGHTAAQTKQPQGLLGTAYDQITGDEDARV